MKTIETSGAPAAIGAYSQAVAANGFVYTSGQIPIDPAAGTMNCGTIEEQTEQVIKNISAILTAAGSGLEYVVKTTCYITDMGKFAAFNEVYAKYFTRKPARSCVEVSALPKNAAVEIEVIAVLPSE